ncbi:uncharacterized protein LOC124169482 [Ischnura elegans]|uniref:uncharacterized protein LOC124169482 n=1 Tax=Ischnura elegans TaxID=197161 RepID=UPI001ED8A213|nr:uncharacterized protein LOC124169482 [Ischnura elegans]
MYLWERNMKWKTSALLPFLVVFLPSFLFMIFISMAHLSEHGPDLMHFGVKMFQDPFVDGNVLFKGFNNNTGAIHPIVPNLVHFVLFGHKKLDFITFLCMMAALKIHRPRHLYLHTDADNQTFSGYYWDQLLLTAAQMMPTNVSESESYFTKVKLMKMPRPTHVYGQPLSSVWHAADVARLDLLKRYGGVALDGDSLMLRPFTQFRHFEMAIGWPKNGYIGSQVIVAHPKARMLHLWLESYRHYKSRLWYYNAGQLPTQQILQYQPNLVHRVPVLFGVHNLAELLYSSSKNVIEEAWWHKEGYYAVHLLSRHRHYLVQSESNSPTSMDEISILKDRTHFGQMARWILYEIEPVLPLPLKDSDG